MKRHSLTSSLAPSGSRESKQRSSNQSSGRSNKKVAQSAFDRWLSSPTDRLLQHDALIVAAEVADALPIDDRASREDAALFLAGMLALAHSGVSRFELSNVSAATEHLHEALGDVIDAGDETRFEIASRIVWQASNGGWPTLVANESAGGASTTPIIRDGTSVAIQRFFAGERRAAQWLPSSPGEAHSDADGILAELLAEPAKLGSGEEIALNEEQQDAVRRALSNEFMSLSGGPGTGKTTVVVGILRALVRSGIAPEDIQLAAPTGRAAWRMVESIRGQLNSLSRTNDKDARLAADLSDARTIHRLLKYSPRRGQFSRHHNHPISAQVVIVDESSMIPLTLMLALFDALAEGAKLILIGDPHQLPPVEAGAVFADIVDAVRAKPELGFSAHLKQSYRMKAKDGGAEILQASEALIASDWDKLNTHTTHRASADDVQFAGMEWLRDDSRAGFQKLVDALWGRLDSRVGAWPFHDDSGPAEDSDESVRADGNLMNDAECKALFDAIQSGKVLCLTRGGRFGVKAINRHLQTSLAKELGAAPGSDAYLPGQPVIVTQNDYDRGIFNGDTGVVVPEVESTGARHLSVWLPRADGGVRFPLDEVEGIIESAFAMTVHKSQGSEFDEIALVLPDDPDLPLLSRNMIYTAMTRARRSVVLFGSENSLKAGMHRTPERQSNFARFWE